MGRPVFADRFPMNDNESLFKYTAMAMRACESHGFHYHTPVGSLENTEL